MNKLSLRWRITLLMGALLSTVCVSLTVFSIQNMKNNIAKPILKLSVDAENIKVIDENSDLIISEEIIDLPEGAIYIPEIEQGIVEAGRSFSVTSYISLVFVVLGGMLATYYLAGRALQPIGKLKTEISNIDVNNLSKRIEVPQTSDEIEALARSFNELLTRLELDFEKEKRFSANAAHELKTPLATIMTSAQVLMMNKDNTIEDFRENLDVTLQSVRRLSSVADGLLLLGGASLETPFEFVNVSEMLYEIERELLPQYANKNIVLTYDLKPITLKGNSVLLYRAFFNLIENALKYTSDNGSVAIASFSNDESIGISITNTASISADDIPNIFEPFYRADKSRSRKIAGAGLGLSIVKEIFDLHDAKIAIHSDHESETMVEVRFKRDKN